MELKREGGLEGISRHGKIVKQDNKAIVFSEFCGEKDNCRRFLLEESKGREIPPSIGDLGGACEE